MYFLALVETGPLHASASQELPTALRHQTAGEEKHSGVPHKLCFVIQSMHNRYNCSVDLCCSCAQVSR